ncbi:PREDICTED: THO complex subunit 7 homolog [Nicrophorus vespilloides]|uniref:THO complex subunit 7 homolog n=1 Tax=Nicrophorus vespilloides TaxID=110193 RepID=A0ABM1MDE6_NICVS|nr:PREDICTED: THO complex subunit 7 homolog [Nicrophorus vespilloides]
MSDEEVIRRRLLIDGDGTGDDRRLNTILKTIIKWTNSDLNEVENDNTYDRLLCQLNQCEYSTKRSTVLANTNNLQLQRYKQLQSVLEIKINDVKEGIEHSKVNLEDAKISKRNRMQYDLLAQSIKEQPARSDTDKRLAALHGELNELKEESQSIDQKLENRRKQFYVLVSSANQLRTMVEEMKNEDAMNTSLDDITNSPGPEPMSE